MLDIGNVILCYILVIPIYIYALRYIGFLCEKKYCKIQHIILGRINWHSYLISITGGYQDSLVGKEAFHKLCLCICI